MESADTNLKSWRLFLPLFWMAIIFWFSGESFSSLHTTKLITPILRVLWPAASPQTLAQINAFLRKSGHFLEYLLLSFFWFWALRPRWPGGRGVLLLAFSLSMGYALFDEIHQSYLPSRTGSLGDVFIDGAGALIIQVFIWFRLRQKRNQVK